MSTKYPKALREEIVAKVRAGEKATDLATQYGINYKTIYYWLHASSGEDVISVLKYNKLKRENEELKWLIGQLSLDLKRGKKD